MTRSDETTFTTWNVTEGAGGPRIDRWKYEAMHRAILLALPPEAPGLPFKKLSAACQT